MVAPAVGLLALLAGVGGLALLLWWYVLAREMPGSSWVRRSMQALIVGTAGTTAILTSLAVMDVASSPRVLLGVFLTAGVVAALGASARARTPLATSSDKWSLTFAAVTSLPLLAPFVTASSGRVLHLLSRTTDGGTHLQMVRAMAQERGLFNLEAPAGWSSGTEQYPLGWASTVWFVLESAFGRHASLAETVHLYGVATVLLYAAVAYMAATVVISSAGTRKRVSQSVGLVALALAVSFGFGLFLLQLNAYTALLALLALLMAIDAAGQQTPAIRTIVLLGAVAIVTAHTWYLLAPVCVGVLLTAAAPLRDHRRALVTAVALVTPLCLFPVLVGPAAGRQIGTIGPVFAPTAIGLIGLLLALVIGMAFILQASDSTSRTHRRALAVATVTCLLEAVVLVVADSEEGTVNYYGAKLLLLAMIFGAIAAAGAVSSWSDPHALPRQKIAASLAVTGLVLGLLSTSGKTLPPSSGKIHAKIDHRLLELLMQRHPEGVPAATDVWFADGCYHLADRISTKWAYDLSLTWTDSRVLSLIDYQRAKAGNVSMIAERQGDPSVRSIEIYVGHTCQQGAINTLAKLSKVIVVHPS